MDPVKCTPLRDSFCAVAENIGKGLFTRRVAAADGYWENWYMICRYVALKPIIISYRDPVPILKYFS